MKKNFFLSMIVLILGIGNTLLTAGEVEVLHYWTSGGEAKSAQVLKEMLEREGHQWRDFRVPGGGGEKALLSLRKRVSAGNPPAAAQVAGKTIQIWGRQGVLTNLDEIAHAGNWPQLLPQVVTDIIKYQDHYVAVPVNVHRINWMWINPHVFRQAGAKIPTTWQEFEISAQKIQKAGFTPVAFGGQPWQEATLFEMIVSGIGGEAFYRRAFVDLDTNTLNSQIMVRAFEILKMVKRYTDKKAANREWNVATAMVIEGKAAMHFMGDWAKGEFTAAGSQPGIDYVCLAAPETSGQFIYNIDSFIMFDLKEEQAKEAQTALARLIMGIQFQEVFNLNKGSIPIRLGMSRRAFDDCAQAAYDAFASSLASNQFLPSMAHEMAVLPPIRTILFKAITDFYNSEMNAETAAQQLETVIKNAHLQ